MKCIASCRYKHPDFGEIKVKVNGQSRAIRARWQGQVLCITVPTNYPVEEYERFLSEYHDDILANKPSSCYYDGQIIDANWADFTIAVDKLAPRDIYAAVNRSNVLRDKSLNIILQIKPEVLEKYPFESPVLERGISDMLWRMATGVGYEFLIPHAREVADRLGVKPRSWDVKKYKTKHGCCSSGGVITLSPHIVFYPIEIIDFIVCHELAHLTYLDHSPAFHQLLNKYLGGRESELVSRLKSLKLPVT